MSELNEAAIYLSDNHPLALDTWGIIYETQRFEAQTTDTLAIGVSSFDMARLTAERAVEQIESETQRALARRALLATVTEQASRNNKGSLSRELLGKYRNEVNGDSDPASMVKMLHEYPIIGAIEIARNTHVGEWNVQQETDQPVRRSLDTVPDTERVDSENKPPRYKIKLFDDDGAMVERKRVVRSHYDGKILTIIRNCMLIDYHSDEMPSKLRKYMTSEHSASRKQADYDFTKESKKLKDELENYVTFRESYEESEKPEWVIPLLTTYYSVDLAEAARQRR